MSSQGSRLTQIQMRYQQKVMQENAQRKNDMYEDTQKLLTSSLGAGKVRAMFDERRSRITAGIDKSYLLEPIAVETKTMTTTKRQVIAPAKTIRDQKMVNYSKVIVPPLQNRLINHDVNGNSHFTADDTFRTGDTALVNFKTTTTTTTTTKAVPKGNSTNAGGTVRKVTTTTTDSSKSPPLKNVTNQKASPSRSMKSGNSTASSNSVRSVTNSKVASNGNSARSGTKVISLAKSQNSQNSSFDDDQPVPEGLARCSICKRNFAEDRLEKHQTICQKTKSKKRKIYDASKKRVQGTEAETYNRKPLSAKASASKPAGGPPKNNSNWRVKHEDFIKTIRAAKEMQAYVAKGGKLSDLPPPPPSENPDYVQCPHCGRRFNEAAANRHIPICQNINKPKAKPSGGGVGSKTSSFAKRR